LNNARDLVLWGPYEGERQNRPALTRDQHRTHNSREQPSSVTPSLSSFEFDAAGAATANPLNRSSRMSGKIMDASLLIWGLQAGAAIAGTEVVKEVTKDCYKSLKSTIADIFGKRAARTIDTLEASPSNTEATDELKAIVGSISAEDSNEIGPKLQALLEALKADDAAKEVIRRKD
jgi:hypothetical protein